MHSGLKALPLLFVGMVILSSGCVNMDPQALAMANPLIQDFLEEHPNADIQMTFFNEIASEEIVGSIREECDNPYIGPKEFYRVNISDPDTDFYAVVWVDWEAKRIECAVKYGTSGKETDKPKEEQGCEHHATYKCKSGNIFWFDSCGNKEDKKEFCPNGCQEGSQSCSEGAACDSHKEYKCHNNHLYWFDSCGNKEEKKKFCEFGCENDECIYDGCETHHEYKCSSGHLYWYDSCGNREEKKQYCENGCSNGECIGYNDTGCIESDSGYDIYNKGCAESGSSSLCDHCNSDGTLTEKYCEGGVIKAKTEVCPEGYECDDAACRETGASCTDSDGGIVTREYGCVDSDGIETCDECMNSTYVLERYCQEGELDSEVVVCSEGYDCISGKCVVHEFSCADVMEEPVEIYQTPYRFSSEFLERSNGDIVTVMWIRDTGNFDGHIYSSISHDNGLTWSEPSLITDFHVGYSSLIENKDNELVFLVEGDASYDSEELYSVYISNDGLSWEHLGNTNPIKKPNIQIRSEGMIQDEEGTYHIAATSLGRCEFTRDPVTNEITWNTDLDKVFIAHSENLLDWTTEEIDNHFHARGLYNVTDVQLVESDGVMHLISQAVSNGCFFGMGYSPADDVSTFDDYESNVISYSTDSNDTYVLLHSTSDDGQEWSEPAVLANGSFYRNAFIYDDDLYVFYSRGDNYPYIYVFFQTLSEGAWSGEENLDYCDMSNENGIEHQSYFLDNSCFGTTIYKSDENYNETSEMNTLFFDILDYDIVR